MKVEFWKKKNHILFSRAKTFDFTDLWLVSKNFRYVFIRFINNPRFLIN